MRPQHWGGNRDSSLNAWVNRSITHRKHHFSPHGMVRRLSLLSRQTEHSVSSGALQLCERVGLDGPATQVACLGIIAVESFLTCRLPDLSFCRELLRLPVASKGSAARDASSRLADLFEDCTEVSVGKDGDVVFGDVVLVCPAEGSDEAGCNGARVALPTKPGVADDVLPFL